MKKYLSLMIIILIFCNSCKKDTLPKPEAMLRLEYPEANYKKISQPCPFNFETNSLAQIQGNDDCLLEIRYQKLNATIHITYREVQDNLIDLLRDAQNLTYGHDVKADGIVEQPYLNEEQRKFGMFYEVTGNAASQSQFYLTDSTRHFITGSLYFYSKPNYDSILPAADYLKKDIRKIIESLSWE